MGTVEAPLFAQSLIHESCKLEEYWVLFMLCSPLCIFSAQS